MNSACIVAACASNGMLRKEPVTEYKQYETSSGSIYYMLKLRKYYHFEPMKLVKANYEPCYIGSVYAPIMASSISFETVDLEAKSFVLEHLFTIPISKCLNGLNGYITENLERFKNSDVWFNSDNKVINQYIDEINRKCNIDLDPSSLKYTNQFCWEVESDVR